MATYSAGLAGAGLLILAGTVSLDPSGPVLRVPTGIELAALAYLAVAVTAVVFLAWFAAMDRLGAERTGLFNGLIPIASLAAVVLVGTGQFTLLRATGAILVLVGVVLGLFVQD